MEAGADREVEVLLHSEDVEAGHAPDPDQVHHILLMVKVTYHQGPEVGVLGLVDLAGAAVDIADQDQEVEVQEEGVLLSCHEAKVGVGVEVLATMIVLLTLICHLQDVTLKKDASGS